MNDSCSISSKQAHDLWVWLVHEPVTQKNAVALINPLLNLLPRQDIETQALARTTVLVLASQDSTKGLFEQPAAIATSGLQMSQLQKWANPSDPAVHLFHLHLRCNLNTSLTLERRCKQLLTYILNQLHEPQWWLREGPGLLALIESLLHQCRRNGGLWPFDQQAMKALEDLVDLEHNAYPMAAVRVISSAQRINSWCCGKPLHPASANVAHFYEQHPYPRWDRLDLSAMADGLRGHLLNAVGSTAMAAVDCEPNRVLVLGCGTGREALAWAAALPQSLITGVDLSATSLDYASQMAQQLGLNNVEWQQEDLLRLSCLSVDYDLVIACGVLHHLPDPAEGLEAATKLVRPGGLIKLALYSAQARRPINQARTMLLDMMGDDPTSEHLAVARAQLIDCIADDPELNPLLRIQEFFDLDGCWDLFFNPCESAFTLPAIEEMLECSFLRFLGFEWDNRHTLTHFRALFPSDRNAVNLHYWTCFEARYPQTFLGMYRFWCQRAAL